jgi:hypothetical protein
MFPPGRARRNKPAPDRVIAAERHYDRYCRSSFTGGADRGPGRRDNDVYLKLNQFGRQCGQAIKLPVGEPLLEYRIAPFHVSQIG